MKTHKTIDSPIGDIQLLNTDGVLSGLYLQTTRYPPAAAEVGEQTRAGFEAVEEQLGEYFTGRPIEFSVPLAPSGTTFQRRVWELLVTIPYGQTRSYAQLALAYGELRAIRAVAAANGRNPISIIIPCHRVIGSDGSLVGYGGGLERKRFLLDLEGKLANAAAPRLF